MIRSREGEMEETEGGVMGMWRWERSWLNSARRGVSFGIMSIGALDFEYSCSLKVS